MCSCIIEFHRSALESGASLLSKPASTKDSKISLSRKNSPCIVITDTDNLCGSSRCCPQRTTHSNLGPQRSLSKHLASKCQVEHQLLLKQTFAFLMGFVMYVTSMHKY